MITKKQKPVKIEPGRYYSLKEIVRMKVMPRGKTYPSVILKVTRELALPSHKRVLRATKVGEGRSARYAVLGRNLLRYIRLNL
jgi:hypothetical protein